MEKLTLNDKLSSLGIKTKKGTWADIYDSFSERSEFKHSAHHLLPEPTIADVLKVDPTYFSTAFLNKSTSTKTFHAIRDKLIEMGFGYDDGIFISYGTKRYWAEKVTEKLGTTKAFEYVDVAEKMGWIKVLHG